MTWREGFAECAGEQFPIDKPAWSNIEVIVREKAAFLAGAKWAANHLDENRVWESREIIDEFKERLEE